MTHGLPGQGGYHHVNLQPPEYWVGKMKQKGYSLSKDNALFLEIAKREESWNYFIKSGLVFVSDR